MKFFVFKTLIFLIVFNQVVTAQSDQKSFVSDKKYTLIAPSENRTFMFTNSIGLYYYGESSLPNSSTFQGLSFLTHKFLEDYLIELNGSYLNRAQAEVHLYNNKLTRFYDREEVEETVSIADSLPILSLKIQSQQKGLISIIPIISGSSQSRDYMLNWSSMEKILFVAQKNHLVQNNDSHVPVWIGISTFPAGDFSEIGTETISKNHQLPGQKLFVPGKINLFLEDVVYMFFIIGKSKKDILEQRQQTFKNLKIKIQKQQLQIEGIRKT